MFGDHKGSLTASVASVTNPTNLTGSVAVAVGDLVFVCFAQQTGLTATGVTDNLGNSYSAVNAGTDAGNATIRCFYSRVTVAGTLTSVAVAATASANDASGIASVIEGPFPTSPLDANPANTQDGTSPHTCPPTGTLAQADEVVMAACAVFGAATLTATSPGVITQVVNRANISSAVQRLLVSATTSVTPEFGAGLTANAAQTTASFKKASITLNQDRYRFYSSGTESGSTPLEAENTLYPLAFSVQGTLQLRVGLQETAGSAGVSTDDYQLQYRHTYNQPGNNTVGSWTNVTTSSSFVKSYNDPNLTDAAATTNRLTAGTGSFVAGKISEDGLVDDLAITASNYTELLYSLEFVVADLSFTDRIEFRVLRNGAVLNTYSQTPIIDISGYSGDEPSDRKGYRFTNTAGPFTGFGQNKLINYTSPDAGSWSGQSIGANGIARASYFLSSGDPGASGRSDRVIWIRIDITTGNVNLRYNARVVRVNSSGVVQSETVYSYETGSGAAGDYFFYSIGDNLGNWNSGDTLRVDILARNVTANTAQSFTLTYCDADPTSVVHAPWASPGGTFNFGDMSGFLVLSNNDLTLTSAAIDTYYLARATSQQYLNFTPGTIPSSDKVYCEFTIGSFGSGTAGGGGTAVGISGFTESFNNYLGFGPTGFGYSDDASVFRNAALVTTLAGYTTGDVIGIAVDLSSNKRLWFRKNNGNWNNSGTANPVTNVGGIDISAMAEGYAVYPAASLYFNNSAVTINIVGTMAYTPPSGYTRWNGTSFANYVDFTGSLPFTVSLAGSFSQTFQLTGNLPFSVNLAGGFSQTFQLTGNLPFSVNLVGGFSQTFQLTGNLPFSVNLAGSFSQTFQLTGDLPFSVNLAGSFDVLKEVKFTGDLPFSVNLAGDFRLATVRLQGSLPVTVDLTGGFSQTFQLTGSLPVTVDLTGGFSQTFQLTGSLPFTVSLAGGFSQTFQLTGDLPFSVNLAGDFRLATVRLQGSLPFTVSLAGDFSKTLLFTADLPFLVDLVGDFDISGTVLFTADLPVTVGLTGDFRLATVRLQGSLPFTVSLAGSFSQTFQLTGDLPFTVSLVGDFSTSEIIQFTGDLPFTVSLDGSFVKVLQLAGNLPFTVSMEGDFRLPVTRLQGNLPFTVSMEGDFRLPAVNLQGSLPFTVSLAGQFNTGLIVLDGSIFVSIGVQPSNAYVGLPWIPITDPPGSWVPIPGVPEPWIPIPTSPEIWAKRQ